MPCEQLVDCLCLVLWGQLLCVPIGSLAAMLVCSTSPTAVLAPEHHTGALVAIVRTARAALELAARRARYANNPQCYGSTYSGCLLTRLAHDQGSLLRCLATLPPIPRADRRSRRAAVALRPSDLFLWPSPPSPVSRHRRGAAAAAVYRRPVIFLAFQEALSTSHRII